MLYGYCFQARVLHMASEFDTFTNVSYFNNAPMLIVNTEHWTLTEAGTRYEEPVNVRCET